MHLPPSNETPIILIGPGTGCAPFRAMIQQRSAASPPAAPTLFFFGARNRTGDYFYGDEWEDLVEQGRLELVTAFSRDQEHKVYVQHRIAEHGARVWELLQMGAVVFLAGNAKQMPQAVSDALEQVAQEYGHVTEAAAWLQQLKKDRRFQMETWA